MVLLDQDGVVQTGAMIGAAAGRDGGLLERAQPGCRLACVENPRACPFDRLDALGGQRGDAGQPLEEVERGSLSGQDRPRGSLDPHHGATLTPPAFLSKTLDRQARVKLVKRVGREIDPEHDSGGLLRDHGPGPGALRHRRRSRDVPVADVLGQCPIDYFADCHGLTIRPTLY